MSTTIILPTNGRKYESYEDIQADWDAYKDFKMIGGPYINREDAKLFNSPSDTLTVVAKNKKGETIRAIIIP